MLAAGIAAFSKTFLQSLAAEPLEVPEEEAKEVAVEARWPTRHMRLVRAGGWECKCLRVCAWV